uniref:Putative leucine-rich repeat protein, plant-type n=1 Tax=Helianthus annuus TaxID=4232 RepID=A0A251U3J7_HELAN
METRFLLIFTFLFFQTFGLSIITTSSNVICIASERQSLLIFKQTLKDKNNLLSTWHGVECCEWHGVLCDNQDGHVVNLICEVKHLWINASKVS